MLKVWILVKSVPKIGRLVGQPPKASNRREQEHCFLMSSVPSRILTSAILPK